METSHPRLQETLQEAREARKAAYAPYSGFRMGAAVVTDSGALVRGVLVENISLGLAMCAERVALFATVTGGLGRPELLALAAPRTAGGLTWPCGACLQVAREFGDGDMLIAVSDGKETLLAHLEDLAPRLPHKSNP